MTTFTEIKDTYKSYKADTVSLGASNTVEMDNKVIEFVESTVSNI